MTKSRGSPRKVTDKSPPMVLHLEEFHMKSLGFNPKLRNEKLGPNKLSYDTAFSYGCSK
jgi:hypothetical protein